MSLVARRACLLGQVHQIEAGHKLLLREVALVPCNKRPDVLQRAPGEAPLHECAKAVATLQPVLFSGCALHVCMYTTLSNPKPWILEVLDFTKLKVIDTSWDERITSNAANRIKTQCCILVAI